MPRRRGEADGQLSPVGLIQAHETLSYIELVRCMTAESARQGHHIVVGEGLAGKGLGSV